MKLSAKFALPRWMPEWILPCGAPRPRSWSTAKGSASRRMWSEILNHVAGAIFGVAAIYTAHPPAKCRRRCRREPRRGPPHGTHRDTMANGIVADCRPWCAARIAAGTKGSRQDQSLSTSRLALSRLAMKLRTAPSRQGYAWRSWRVWRIQVRHHGSSARSTSC
jgi:hypothetical protein